MLTIEFRLVPRLKNECSSTNTRLIYPTGVGREDVIFNNYPVYIDSLKGLGFQRKVLDCVVSIPLCTLIKFYYRNRLYWVWNLVTDIEGGTWAEGVREQGVEESIWA